MSTSIHHDDDDDQLNDFLNETSDIRPPQSYINYLEQDDSNDDPLTNSNSFEITPNSMQLSPSRPLEIIAQPACTSKARYRTDYLPPSNRRDPLGNKKPHSNYTGPAIRIFSIYLQPDIYFIGVSLVTPVYKNSEDCFIHPYTLESIDHKDYNNESENIVWYPIDDQDQAGVKSFPDLRIVLKTEDELQRYGDLHRFHGFSSNLLNDHIQSTLSTRQMVAQYNLKKARLAFFLGQKLNIDDRHPTMIHSSLIFSDELFLVPDKKLVQSTEQSNLRLPPVCQVDKYAPRYGFAHGGDEMLLSLTRRPEEKKYGDIKIQFQSIPSNQEWSSDVDTIEVKYQTISFRIPSYPWSITVQTTVNVIVQQGDTVLKLLEYSYIPQFQCITCQAQARSLPTTFVRSYSNKRTKSSMSGFDDESDALVPTSPRSPIFQQTSVEQESDSSQTTPEPQPNIKPVDSCDDLIMQKLDESIEQLFMKNDYRPILRTCRTYVQKRPKLLHDAISYGYSDLVSTFVPIAGMKLMQAKNEHGETALLQATRLNYLNIVRAVLGRKESDKLLEDTNNKRQNIFHILALNTDSNEILDWIIDYLNKKSMDIDKIFDHNDEDHYTPLQLAILQNNLNATRHFLKYFNTNVYKTSGDVRDNLIHLCIRHGDLAMLKYLLEEGQMIELGEESNPLMTPLELAQSMDRADMIDYLKTMYPPIEMNKNKDSEQE